MKILVVIPCYNEEENIDSVLKDLKKNFSIADILVVNDKSTDRTLEIVKKNNIKCITTVFNMGYAMAIQTGIKYAYENDYDYVIQFDGDGQHIAKEAIKLVNKMKKSNADIVIGSRYMPGSIYEPNFFRKLGSKIFSFLINLFYKKKIYDTLSGFQCLNKTVIKVYATMGEYPEYPDANLLMQMIIDGYQIEEIPVEMKQRIHGESIHSGIIKPIKYMIKMFYIIFVVVLLNLRRKKK